MSYNGNGVFLINTAGQPVVVGTTITATAFNLLTSDLANGLTNAITKDGQSTVTSNIPMSNFRITGLGAAVNPNDAVRLAQLQDAIVNARFINLEYTGTLTGGTGVVAIGTNQIYKDAAGLVGLGTATPATNLDVVGPEGKTSFTGTDKLGVAIRGSTDVDDYSGVDFYGNSQTIPVARIAALTTADGSSLSFGTSNTYASGITNIAMNIAETGNVGINTIDPATNLDVAGPAGVTSFTGSTKLGLAVRGSEAANDYSGIDFYGNNQTNPMARIAVLTTGGGASLRFGTSDVYATGITNTAMTIADIGNVGIGTTAPDATYSLHVAGNVLTTGSLRVEGSNIRASGGGSAAAPSIQPGEDADTGMYWAGSNTIGFSTAGTLKAQIANDGVITTFANSSANYGFYVTNSNASPLGIRATYSTAAPNGTGNLFYLASDNVGTKFTVRSNGGIANYQANDANLSDRREKKDFEPSDNYLDKLCQIPVQKFRYINQAADDDGMSIGVIAQDVQAVLPELVSESDWSNGEEGAEPKMRLSIYQTDLQYVMMKAIQELKAEFDAYKAAHP